MCDDFSGVRVGDKLWSIQLGECVVTHPDGVEGHIHCENFSGEERGYLLNGKDHEDDAHQSLFWSRPEIIAPPRPKRMVKKTVERWVNVYENGEGCKTVAHTAYTSMSAARMGISDIGCVKTIKLTGEYEVEE